MNKNSPIDDEDGFEGFAKLDPTLLARHPHGKELPADIFPGGTDAQEAHHQDIIAIDSPHDVFGDGDDFTFEPQ